MKRIISFLLVLTMLCSFGMAFAQEEAPAEEPAAEEQAVEITAEEPAEEAEEAAEAVPEETAEEPAEEPAEEAAPAEEMPVTDGASEEPAEVSAAPAVDGAGLDAGSIPLALGGSATATIDGSHKSYTYKINVTSAGRVELAWTSDGYYIWTYLYDANGNEVFHGSGSWAPGGVTKNTYTYDLTAQTYYLVLSQCSSGSHEFTLTASLLSDAQETYKDTGTNNTLATASNAVLGTTYKGLIAYNDTVDIYKFTLSSADSIQLKLIAQMARVYLYLYDEDGNRLAEYSPSWDSTIGQSSNTYSQELEAGTYYVSLSKYYSTWGSNANMTGAYSLKISPGSYTVSYDANGGSGAPASQTKSSGQSLTLSSTKPTRTGYTFKGWAADSAATTAEYAAGGSYTANESVTLYAVWKLKTYAVNYDANGGSGAPAKQTKTYGKTLTLSSEVPTRTGYTFKGWAAESTATAADYSAGGKYTANASVTLYAVWKINTYTVSYNANGGSGAPAKQTKTYGKTLTLDSTEPTRSGYIFLGWATSKTATTAKYTAGGSYTANKSVTLYAVWEEIREGWVRVGDVTYYYRDGSRVTGWQLIDGKEYYFRLADGSMATGWVILGEDRFYMDSNGVMQTGWQKVGDNRYYLNTNGVMQTGWQLIDGKEYYFRTESGSMVTGWLILGENRYYMDTNGVMQTGWQKVGDNRYYLNTNGVMQTGWLQLGGSWYYFRMTDGSMATGWVILGEDRFYMDSNGVMQTGWQKVGDNWYYLNVEGVMQTGWQQIGSKWYYFRTKDGTMATGWLIIAEDTFYMDSDGVMQTGWQKVGDNWYYLNVQGAMVKSAWLQAGSSWYYLRDNGRMAVGRQTIDGSTYYFNTDGVMQTGWISYSGYWHYFVSSGTMLKSSWLKSGSSWYYLNSSGVMVTGKKTIDGSTYIFSDAGVMQTGWVSYGGYWYYCNTSGVMQIGWLKSGSSWYYFKSSGKMATGTFTVDGAAQKFSDDGVWIGEA